MENQTFCPLPWNPWNKPNIQFLSGRNRKYLKELEDENKIFPLTAEGPRDIHYMLKADIQLQLLIDMKKSPQKPAFLISSRLSPSNNWRKEEWVIIIQDYVLGKNLKSQLPSYADFEPLRYILMHMPTFPEWMPFFKIFPYTSSTLFFTNTIYMGIRVASSQHNLYDKRILWKWKNRTDNPRKI